MIGIPVFKHCGTKLWRDKCASYQQKIVNSKIFFNSEVRAFKKYRNVCSHVPVVRHRGRQNQRQRMGFAVEVLQLGLAMQAAKCVQQFRQTVTRVQLLCIRVMVNFNNIPSSKQSS